MVGLLVALLAFVLASVNGLEETLRATNERLDGVNGRLQATRDETAAIDRRVQPLSRTVPREVAAIEPDVDAIATDMLPSVERATTALAGAVLPLAEQIEAADPARLGATAQRLAASVTDLLASRPVGELITSANALVADVRRLGLPDVAVRGLGELEQVDDRLAATNRRLGEVRESIEASVRVQCRIYERIASLDRKTGGEVPPDAPADEAPADCRRRGG